MKEQRTVGLAKEVGAPGGSVANGGRGLNCSSLTDDKQASNQHKNHGWRCQ